MNINIICSSKLNDNTSLKESQIKFSVKKNQNQTVYKKHLEHLVFVSLNRLECAINISSYRYCNKYFDLFDVDEVDQSDEEYRLDSNENNNKSNKIEQIPDEFIFKDRTINATNICKKPLLSLILSRYIKNHNYSKDCQCKEFDKILEDDAFKKITKNNPVQTSSNCSLGIAMMTKYIRKKSLKHGIDIFHNAKFLMLFYSKFYRRTIENELDFSKIIDEFTETVKIEKAFITNIIDVLNLYHMILSDFSTVIQEISNTIIKQNSILVKLAHEMFGDHISENPLSYNKTHCPKLRDMQDETVLSILKNILNKIQIQCEYIDKFKANNQHVVINQSNGLNQSMYDKHYPFTESKNNQSCIEPQLTLDTSVCKSLNYNEDLHSQSISQDTSEFNIKKQTIESFDEKNPLNKLELDDEPVIQTNQFHTSIFDSYNITKSITKIDDELFIEEYNPIMTTSTNKLKEQVTQIYNKPVTDIGGFINNKQIIEQPKLNINESYETHDYSTSYHDINLLFNESQFNNEFSQEQSIINNNMNTQMITDKIETNILNESIVSHIDELNYTETQSNEDHNDSIIYDLESDDINNKKFDDILVETLKNEEYNSVIIDIRSISTSKLKPHEHKLKSSHRLFIEEIPEETESEITDNETDFKNQLQTPEPYSALDNEFEKQLIERRKACEEKFKNTIQVSSAQIKKVESQQISSNTNISFSENPEDKIKNITTSTIDSSVIESTYTNYKYEEYQPEEHDIIFNKQVYSNELEEKQIAPNITINNLPINFINNTQIDSIENLSQEQPLPSISYNENLFVEPLNEEFSMRHNIIYPGPNTSTVVNDLNNNNIRQLNVHEAIDTQYISIPTDKLIMLILLFIVIPALIISWIIVKVVA